MAAVELPNAFNYKWAENGTVDVIDDSQWKAGWAFVGSTPPSVEQFNRAFQIFDEKANFLRAKLNTDFAASLTSPGWQKLSSGLIIQWGGVSGYSTYTVTFPLAFPTAPLALFGINNGTAGTIPCTMAFISQTQCSLHMSTVGSAYWMAIGR